MKCADKLQNYGIFLLVFIWCVVSLKLGATKNAELEQMREQVLNMDINDKNYQKTKIKLQEQTDILLKIL